MGDYVTDEDLTMLDKVNKVVALIAEYVLGMFDQDKDGKLSETDFKNDIEKVEALIGIGFWLHLTTFMFGRNPWSAFYY